MQRRRNAEVTLTKVPPDQPASQPTSEPAVEPPANRAKPRSSRRPGPPVELFVYRYVDHGPPGGQRDLLLNTVDASVESALYRLFGEGKYRLEWRDARRFVVTARTVLVTAEGHAIPNPARHRPPPRRAVPLPTGIPPTPPSAPLIEHVEESDPNADAGDGTGNVEPARQRTRAPAQLIPGPPADRHDPYAVGAWVEHVLGVLVREWEKAHEALRSAWKSLDEREHAEANEFFALHRAALNGCDGIRAQPVAPDFIGAWLEDVHRWVSGQITAARGWETWARRDFRTI